jgi:hypothetical protein
MCGAGAGRCTHLTRLLHRFTLPLLALGPSSQTAIAYLLLHGAGEGFILEQGVEFLKGRLDSILKVQERKEHVYAMLIVVRRNEHNMPRVVAG